MSNKRVSLILLGLGLFLLVLGLGYAFYLQREESVSPAPLPWELGGQPLSRAITGPTALTELSWMHGQEFQLNQGAVGSYGRDGEITIYVAGTPLKYMTGRLLTAMRDKIDEVNSPFSPIAEREIDQRMIYELEGMGQRHFYFRSDDLIVWLAVDNSYAEEALQEILIFYP